MKQTHTLFSLDIYVKAGTGAMFGFALQITSLLQVSHLALYPWLIIVESLVENVSFQEGLEFRD